MPTGLAYEICLREGQREERGEEENLISQWIFVIHNSKDKFEILTQRHF